MFESETYRIFEDSMRANGMQKHSKESNGTRRKLHDVVFFCFELEFYGNVIAIATFLGGLTFLFRWCRLPYKTVLKDT